MKIMVNTGMYDKHIYASQAMGLNQIFDKNILFMTALPLARLISSE